MDLEFVDDSAIAVAKRLSDDDWNLQLSKACISDGQLTNFGIVDVCSAPSGRYMAVNSKISGPDDLNKLLSPANPEPKLRVIFLNQSHSWTALQVTKPVLHTLITHYGMMPEFLELASSFCDRMDDIQLGDCYQLQTMDTQFAHELCYAYKYVEMKTCDAGNPWRIRQTGIYHRVDPATSHSLLVVMSPLPLSAFEITLRGALSDSEGQSQLLSNPLLAHNMLIRIHLKGMRNYLEYIEKDLQKIWNDAITSMIDEPLTVTQKNLSMVRFLESQMHPTLPILSHCESIMDGLSHWAREVGSCYQLTDHMQQAMRRHKANIERQAQSYRQNVLYLLERSRTTSQTIVDLLNLQNQRTTQVMAHSSMEDSKDIRVITLVTLVYLPSSYIATVLGMDLFNFNTQTKRLEIGKQFWIYVAITVPLTFITMSFWRWKARPHRQRRKIQRRLQEAIEMQASL